MLMKLISDPIPTAQTIAGTLDWVVGVGESSTSQNAFHKLHVYVLREPDTLVGTLLGSPTAYEEASTSGNEWAINTSAVGKGPATPPGKPTLTQVAAQAGDRIVIEFGWVGYSALGSTGYYYYGGGLNDMAVGGVTNQASWFEFSQDIFGSRISKPSGTVAGDVMIATIAVRPNTATITTPAGWTPVLPRVDNSAGTASLAIYRRTADASDSSVTDYAWSTSGATFAMGTIQSFSGVDTANPIDVWNGQATASSTTHATPDVTTTVANTLLIAAHAMASGSVSWTPPTGMTEIVDVQVGSTTGGITLEKSTVVQSTAGATGAKTATNGSNTTPYSGVTHILALRGIGAGGSNTLTINMPTGVLQNDVMIASIAVGPSTVTITPPAGWGLVKRMDQASGTSNSLAVYSKLAGLGEAGSYDWTFSAGHTGAAGGIMAFSGADPVIEKEDGQSDTGSVTSHATPSVAPAFANTMVVTSYGIGATSTWTPPPGMTEKVDLQGGSQALEVSYVPQAAAASVSKTATSSSAGYGNAHILVLRRVFGSFNAFETSTGATIGGVIKTKIAGTTINVAIIALNAPKTAVATYYIGTMKIEALDASNSSGVVDPNTGCNSTWTPITPAVVIPDLSFAAADNGRKNTSFTVPNSYPHVRLRMSAPSGAPDTIACSGDGFAIRPDHFTTVSFKDNDWQTANTSGPGRTLSNLTVPLGTVHKAGQPFTVRATAVNSDGTTTSTNYAGTITALPPSACVGTACVASPSGTLTVGAGSVAAGVFTSHVATYSDVGAIAVTLVDSTFANVDSTDGSTATEMNIT